MCYEENRFQLAGSGGHTGNLYLVKAASMHWEAYWQRRCVCNAIRPYDLPYDSPLTPPMISALSLFNAIGGNHCAGGEVIGGKRE